MNSSGGPFRGLRHPDEVLRATEAFLLVAQQAQDDLVIALAGDKNEGTLRALAAWREVRLQSLQTRYMERVKKYTHPDRAARLHAALDAYVTAVDGVGRPALVGRDDASAPGIADVFAGLRAAAEELINDANVAERRKRLMFQVLTVVGSAFVSVLASTGIGARFGANLGVVLEGRVPASLAWLLKNPDRNEEYLGSATACSPEDKKLVPQGNQLQLQGACASWSVNPWRAGLEKGIVLSADIVPPKNVKNVFALLIRGDGERIKRIPGLAGDEMRLCVIGMSEDTDMHFLVFYEKDLHTEVRGAKAVMTDFDPDETCGIRNKQH